ncbi:MAG: CCA tRNA nucleotidyltransferase [Planctomycetes bacterium]|nr:CCA tRNA nucleotidyltransferase [Planctomycetota bacterium]MBI3844661.1 CCA tRNA nucleotidyltransferase [Planctomycetota bacterium]
MNAREQSLRIAETLRREGYRAVLTGGCVRDSLLGRNPKDFDVATDATPVVVQRLFEKTHAVGAKFGVVVVLIDGQSFEVATFRADGKYSDGRHPEDVRFGDEVADARRRDFTVNGLFFDPTTGEVLDYVSGLDDVRCGVIRTIGNPAERFEEDHLRLIRAVRFAAQLDFVIDPATRKAIEERSASIRTVSAERIREEICRILVGANPGKGMRVLHETGLLHHVLPEVEAMVGIEQPADFHPEGDVFTHVCLMLSRMQQPSVELAMGVLLHDVGKPATFERLDRIRFNRHAEVGAQMTRGICERLRFSRKQTECIEALVADHMKFLNVRDMRQSRLRRFLAKDAIEEHLALHRLDCLGSHGKLDNYEFCRAALGVLANEPSLPSAILSGHDLIAAGYAPGPRFSMILSAALDAQLEGEIVDREDALRFVRERFPLLESGRRDGAPRNEADGK